MTLQASQFLTHLPENERMCPGEGPFLKGNVVFQPSMFRGYVSFQDGKRFWLALSLFQSALHLLIKWRYLIDNKRGRNPLFHDSWHLCRDRDLKTHVEHIVHLYFIYS